MNNLLESVFTPTQTLLLVIIAVVGVGLIVLNIVLASVFHKRRERKLYDMLLQQQKELLMKQLELLRAGELDIDDMYYAKDFFNRGYVPEANKEVQPAVNEELKAEEPLKEEVVEEETCEVPDEPEEDDLDDETVLAEELADDDDNLVVFEEETVNGVVVRYNRSFTARLTQASDSLKKYYSDLKNYILSYKGTRSRLSWKREIFCHGRSTLITFAVRGKTLCLAFAANPADFEGSKYRIINLSVKRPNCKQPVLYRISSDRKAKYALEIIDKVLTEKGSVKTDRAYEDFAMPYDTTENLIESGLIRLKEGKALNIQQN